MMKNTEKFYPRRICNYKKPELGEVGDNACGLPIFAVFRHLQNRFRLRLRPVRILPAATGKYTFEMGSFSSLAAGGEGVVVNSMTMSTSWLRIRFPK